MVAAGRGLEWRIRLSLGTVYLVWGSTYMAIRVMVRTIPPLIGAGTRFLVAGAGLAAWAALRRPGSLRVDRAQLGGAAVVGLLILGGGIGLVTVAEKDVPSALTALLVASVPLWVVVLRVLAREEVPRRTVGAVGLGLVGLVVLLLPGGKGAATDVGPAALVVAAAVLTAVGIFSATRLSMPAWSVVSTTLEMLVAGGVLVVVGVAVGERVTSFSDVSPESAWALLYLVVAGSIVAYSAFAWLLENAPPSTVATYAYVNPVVAVVLGASFLAESVTLPMIAGAVIVVASVAVTVRSESRVQAPE